MTTTEDKVTGYVGRVWAISDETPGSTTKGGPDYVRKHVKACESVRDILAALCIGGPP